MTLTLNQGPFPRPELPGFAGTTDLSPVDKSVNHWESLGVWFPWESVGVWFPVGIGGNRWVSGFPWESVGVWFSRGTAHNKD
jgi:hypothetical protein